MPMISLEKNLLGGIPDDDLGCMFHAGLMLEREEKAVIILARNDAEFMAELTLIAAVSGSFSKMWHLFDAENGTK